MGSAPPPALPPLGNRGAAPPAQEARSNANRRSRSEAPPQRRGLRPSESGEELQSAEAAVAMAEAAVAAGSDAGDAWRRPRRQSRGDKDAGSRNAASPGSSNADAAQPGRSAALPSKGAGSTSLPHLPRIAATGASQRPTGE